jgi:hypothetical protein
MAAAVAAAAAAVAVGELLALLAVRTVSSGDLAKKGAKRSRPRGSSVQVEPAGLTPPERRHMPGSLSVMLVCSQLMTGSPEARAHVRELLTSVRSSADLASQASSDMLPPRLSAEPRLGSWWDEGRGGLSLEDGSELVVRCAERLQWSDALSKIWKRRRSDNQRALTRAVARYASSNTKLNFAQHPAAAAPGRAVSAESQVFAQGEILASLRGAPHEFSALVSVLGDDLLSKVLAGRHSGAVLGAATGSVEAKAQARIFAVAVAVRLPAQPAETANLSPILQALTTLLDANTAAIVAVLDHRPKLSAAEIVVSNSAAIVANSIDGASERPDGAAPLVRYMAHLLLDDPQKARRIVAAQLARLLEGPAGLSRVERFSKPVKSPQHPDVPLYIHASLAGFFVGSMLLAERVVVPEDRPADAFDYPPFARIAIEVIAERPLPRLSHEQTIADGVAARDAFTEDSRDVTISDAYGYYVLNQQRVVAPAAWDGL